ncbi:hypothetical protein EON64_13385, partial [archaeon]
MPILLVEIKLSTSLILIYIIGKDAEEHTKKKSKSRDATMLLQTPTKDENLSIVNPGLIKPSQQDALSHPTASGLVPQDASLALSPIMPTKSTRPLSTRKAGNKPPPAFTFSPSQATRKQMQPTATEMALLSPSHSRLASDCVLSTPLTPSSVRRLSKGEGGSPRPSSLPNSGVVAASPRVLAGGSPRPYMPSKTEEHI